MEESKNSPKSIYIGTWNVNGKIPEDICLKEWLCPEVLKVQPDIYGIAFQELEWTSDSSNNSSVVQDWKNLIQKALTLEYVELDASRLDGILLLTFIKSNLKQEVSQVSSVPHVVAKYPKGDKGAVATSITFLNCSSSICLINCHLEPHVHQLQKRNEQYHEICDKIHFPTGRKLFDHDQIFFFGDLNYRINPKGLDDLEIKSLVESGTFEKVLEHDQLLEEMKSGKVFQGFVEASINFKPTYKYNAGTDDWDSEKLRGPAYCDRILYRGGGVSQVYYDSCHQYKLSDHKPVSATYFIN